jgi:hypothetical protein
MKKSVLLLVALSLFAIPALAQDGAEWVPVKVHFSWDQSMAGFCVNESQCLVHIQGNETFDGDVERLFRFPGVQSAKFWPRCLNDTQSFMDYRCENGTWSTRTKHVALQLLQYASAQSPTNYTLFCDRYDRVLNNYWYFLQGVLVENYLRVNCPAPEQGGIMPCVNSMCVLKTPNAVAVGAALNIPVNNAQHSFLKALNKSVTACNSVSATAASFLPCAPGEPNVWYNPSINAVIFLLSGGFTAVTPATAAALPDALGAITPYVMSVLHKPANPDFNFNYFPKTRLFNHVYFARNGPKSVFGFLEEGMRPEENRVRLDYIGVRYSGISLGADPCLTFVKKYDDKAFCENQTTPVTGGFNVVARHRCEPSQPDCKGASPIVNVWPALTGKLRP